MNCLNEALPFTHQNPAGELARTYRFLGLDDSYLPAEMRREANVVPYVLPRYTAEERQRQIAYFADDVAQDDVAQDDVAQSVELCPKLDLGLLRDFVSSTME